MTICRFYLEGRCRYGDRCWNEHSDPSSTPQRRDQYSWVSPSVGSRNFPQPQFSRNSFSSSFRDPAPRYNYDSRNSTPTRSNYGDPAPRYNYDYDSRSTSPTRSNYRDPAVRSNYDYGYDSRSSSLPRNQFSDRFGSSNVRSGYEDYASNQQRQSTPFQLKSSNRFEVLAPVNDTGRNDRETNLVSMLKNDITSWENTHIWPFSCCSHFRDLGACLSGFVDISPEELRYRAYEAEKNGAFDFYTRTVADALNEVKKKWSVLKNPTSEILQSVDKGYHIAPDFCEENLKKLIPESSAGSFNSEQQISSEMLPQEHPKTSAFSFKLAHLGSPESSESSTSAFRSVLPTSNTVGSSFPTFGALSSGMSSAASSSGFAATSVPSSASSGFGLLTKERNEVSAKTAGTSDIKSSAYTELENLTDNERAQFSSQTFTLGKIPSRPPPIELCF